MIKYVVVMNMNKDDDFVFIIKTTEKYLQKCINNYIIYDSNYNVLYIGNTPTIENLLIESESVYTCEYSPEKNYVFSCDIALQYINCARIL